MRVRQCRHARTCQGSGLNFTMLTDTKLRNLKPKDKLYEVNGRDGLYVAVTPAGVVSFRCNYAIHGRQEISTGVGGLTDWAVVEPLAGRESFAVDAARSEVTARVRMRCRPGLTGKDRVVHERTIYNVVSAVDARSEHREPVLM